MTVKAGEPFDVGLEVKPSTGYLWEIRQLPAEVVLLGSDLAQPEANAAPGHPVRQIFHFRVTKAGDYEVQLDLKRSWEQKGIQSRSVRIRAHS